MTLLLLCATLLILSSQIMFQQTVRLSHLGAKQTALHQIITSPNNSPTWVFQSLIVTQKRNEFHKCNFYDQR